MATSQDTVIILMTYGEFVGSSMRLCLKGWLPKVHCSDVSRCLAMHIRVIPPELILAGWRGRVSPLERLWKNPRVETGDDSIHLAIDRPLFTIIGAWPR